MARSYRQQKKILTELVNKGEPEAILAEVHKTFAEWDKSGMWPDNWSRWQRAADDAIGRRKYAN